MPLAGTLSIAQRAQCASAQPRLGHAFVGARCSDPARRLRLTHRQRSYGARAASLGMDAVDAGVEQVALRVECATSERGSLSGSNVGGYTRRLAGFVHME